ncbi:glycosyltransferase, partial [Microbispora rosea]
MAIADEGTDEYKVQRVVLLIGHLGLGGAQRQLCLLAERLRDRGVEVHVFVLSRGGPHEDDLRAAGIPVHRLGFSRGVVSPARNLRAFARLVRLLRRLRPEIVHGFLYESYLLGSAVLRSGSISMPSLVSPVVASARTR